MSGYADPHATQTQPIAIGERGGPRNRGLSWHGGASSPLAMGCVWVACGSA